MSVTSLLVFCKSDGIHNQLCTAAPDGSGLAALTADTHYYNWARWSPDGTKILAGDSSQRLWVCNADGSGLTQITNLDTGLSNLGFFQGDWSPDGTQCVVLANEDPTFGQFANLQIVNIDNSGHTVITLTTKLTLYLNCAVSWSPDGTKFLYPSKNTFYGGLNATSCLIDGSSPTNILTADFTTVDQYVPWRWYPDSTNILVVEHPSHPPGGNDNLLKSDGSTTTTLYAGGGDLNAASTLGAMNSDGMQFAWNNTAASGVETLIAGSTGGFSTGGANSISSEGLDWKDIVTPPSNISAGRPASGIRRYPR